ncbi:uncharacterized protein EV422DRAFT_563395 [Fimicolochytrium jonesii]|uniref:uncharacterized protein n=1 Tax=Fimicolochytrium jonesii TaxID=1396493 RepID=UPI0022FE9B7A|nr:uncharacterized protein EV422DRAFT_563395 [Fimicolochytrium jonesii]KAI8825562.1 hypothetical protein EV422DRAFT_563395 [Fimicolochytrium jonesii]
MLWLFDEAIPLALDPSTLLAGVSTDPYKDVLRRLLTMFVRFQKRNYITLTYFLLGSLESGRLPPKIIPHLSSEDMEVFNSVLRNATRHQDTHDQVARKALYLTATNVSVTHSLASFTNVQQLESALEFEQLGLTTYRRQAILDIFDGLKRKFEIACGQGSKDVVLDGDQPKERQAESSVDFKGRLVYELRPASAGGQGKRPALIVSIPEALLPPQVWCASKNTIGNSNQLPSSCSNADSSRLEGQYSTHAPCGHAVNSIAIRCVDTENTPYPTIPVGHPSCQQATRQPPAAF